MSQSKIIGAVEIGTAKTLVLIGELIPGQTCNIIGKGSCSTMGLKKGIISDLKAATDSVHAAILSAEKAAQVTLDCVYLSQSGPHLRGFWNEGSAAVSRADEIVSRADIQRAEDDAKNKQAPPGHVLIHHIHNGFRLDGKPVDNPLTMEGRRLEVGYWSVSGEERRIRDQLRLFQSFGIEVEDMIISSIASGVMVTDEEEKEAGALVIDIGSGTSDFAVYKDGHTVLTGVVPVGGDHLTNDLSLGLRISRKNAEYLKLEHGRGCPEKKDAHELVWLFGDLTIGDRKFRRQAIDQILHARVDELFSIIRKEVGKRCNPEFLAAGAILTGGTAQLPGIEQVAAARLGVEARIGVNPGWVRQDMRSPEFSTVLGLMHYAVVGHHDSDRPQPTSSSLFRKVARILNLNLD